MKNEVLYLLLNNYADHEPAFLASAIACDEYSIKENPKYINKVVAPTLDAVRSCSGFRTLPDYSFDTMPDDYWKSHATLTLLAKQNLLPFGYNMIDPLKSWCWGSILFYPFKISRFS